ncbi:SPX and EXS domain-containing protein 1-like isoform X3 [Hibiscus syriacus]|uniref:SPX and EXS domain-containing protein 1-like isoform X3 n=1 Tax=Hibiscus syriacus TaxID=106335 RepID=A0A6A3BGT1_HIBSY|nr:SPX and EXS domain-containing protein 1-like isoform X3 [Hibiscus syriacus]
MKVTNSIMHTTAAIMPSPLFLWRLQVLFFLAWGFTCCKIGWDSVMRMNADLRDLFLYEAFLYYNPLLLLTMMVWLWGVCLWVFSESTVNYARIFDLDQNHLTHREIWKCSIWTTIIVPTSMTAYLYLYSHGEVALAASQPPISFPDFFLADILTSMAKIWSVQSVEWFIPRIMLLNCLDDTNQVTSVIEELLLFFEVPGLSTVNARGVATIAWFEADSVCGSHSVAIPVVLVIPYIWRLMQCLRQYKDTKEKMTLLNGNAFESLLSFIYIALVCLLTLALKYSTAVPVIFLSALKYHVLPDRWTYVYRRLWLFSSFVNSLYSFYWDVTRDWDLSVFTRIFKFNKPNCCSNLLYGRQWVYFWVLGSNLVLRCTWTYKLSAHLRHNYLTVFTVTTLEMLRRFQWIFFRVENEWNKITKSSSQIPMADIPREDEKLLDSTNHSL